MKGSWFFIIGAILLVLQGCVTPPDYHYAQFFENHPRSILVLPPFNKTTAVDAPILFNTTVSVPFAGRGYYIFPVFLTSDILQDLGLSNEGLIAEVSPQRFKEVFGADAVLFVTINSWATTYLLLASTVTVQANYKLVDTATGEILWERTETVAQGSGGGQQGLIGMLVSAAVHAMVTDYRPLARQTNNQVVSKTNAGLPAGPYHPDYKKDYSSYNP